MKFKVHSSSRLTKSILILVLLSMAMIQACKSPSSSSSDDPDDAGITVGAISGDTTEVGGTATFTVKLPDQPSADVTVSVESSDTTEGIVDSASLSFSTSNWNDEQTVTITGQDDLVLDGAVSYSINLSAADGGYDGKTATVSLSNLEVYRLPDTGQTGSYTTIPGEDSDYTINSPSYIDNGDYTVTDHNTGLIWQQCSYGQTEDATCSGTATPYNWYQATGTFHSTLNPGPTDVCTVLVLGGQTDWRLPNRRELMSLVDYGISGPAIDTAFFPGTLSYYWSFTEYADGTSTNAWYVHFTAGYTDQVGKSDTNTVRCVRGQATQEAPNLVDQTDGTVLDQDTRLVWQQAEGGNMDWEAALSYCEGLELASHNDWRLPNLKELESIVDATKYLPAIDSLFSGVVSSFYWSSTTYMSSISPAWGVFFDNGFVDSYDKSSSYNVRCVRGGQ